MAVWDGEVAELYACPCARSAFIVQRKFGCFFRGQEGYENIDSLATQSMKIIVEPVAAARPRRNCEPGGCVDFNPICH